MEHSELITRLRREAGQFGHVSRFAARDAADALEAAQAENAKLRAELAVTRKERDGVRKALDYLLSDPAVPPSALERTRVLMQHYKAAQP